MRSPQRRWIRASAAGEAAVEIDRGDHRLHGVAQKRLFPAAAGQHLGAAELQHVAERDLARDLGAGFLAHQRVEAGGKLAFGRPLVGVQERLGHHQAQHPVAEEFEALVVGARGRRTSRRG
jgi:hypothetical protein